MTATLAALVLALLGCSGGETVQTAEEQAAQKCPKVHLDRLAGDWLMFSGTADPTHRFRIEADGDGYRMYYVAGFFQKVELAGVKREKEVQFTEVPRGKRKEFVERGEADRTRIYVTPEYETCSLAVMAGTVSQDDSEAIPPKSVEYVEFPDTKGEVFTFLPADDALFAGDAAKDKAKADKQVEELGGPKADFEGNPVPIGMFAKAEDDGAADCTYDMDLYFDDNHNEPKLEKIPAGEVKDGFRHWYHEWDANYGGNHHFEMYRYRTCAGGERELIGVAALEATLS